MSDHRDSHSRDIIKGSHRGSVSPRMDRGGGSPPPRRGGGGRNRSRSGSRGRAHRSRSFSRSRSHSAGRKYSKRAERSTSRSRGAGGGGGHRAYSKSPVGSSRRFDTTRDNPEPNKCLGVFGLSLRTTERDLRDVFGRYGPIEECTVVIDAQTGRSRGFAFIYFEAVPDAKAAKESCNGIDIDGRRIRVDFSITQRAHTPTPGIYMGRASSRRSNYGGHNNGYNNYGGRRSGGGGGGGYGGGGGGGGGRDFRRRDGGGGGGGYGGGGGGRSDFRRGGGGGDRRSPSPYYSSSRNRKRATRSRSYSPSPRGKYY